MKPKIFIFEFPICDATKTKSLLDNVKERRKARKKRRKSDASLRASENIQIDADITADINNNPIVTITKMNLII